GHAAEGARHLMGAADAEARDLERAQAVDAMDAVQDDLTGRRALRAGDQAQQRRLAGAVRADHPQQLAGGDVEAHVGDRNDAAEALADTAQGKERDLLGRDSQCAHVVVLRILDYAEERTTVESSMLWPRYDVYGRPPAW